MAETPQLQRWIQLFGWGSSVQTNIILSFLNWKITKKDWENPRRATDRWKNPRKRLFRTGSNILVEGKQSTWCDDDLCFPSVGCEWVSLHFVKGKNFLVGFSSGSVLVVNIIGFSSAWFFLLWKNEAKKMLGCRRVETLQLPMVSPTCLVSGHTTWRKISFQATSNPHPTFQASRLAAG